LLFDWEPRSNQLVGIARLAAQGEVLENKQRVRYLELPTRRFINRVSAERMPFQWAINPYRGCEFGCKYCYARYTHEFMELRESRHFEEQIYAKQFDASAFRAELRRIPRAHSIAIGTATDPYQPAERRFRITRRIFEIFACERGRSFGLVTKSNLVVRDIDVLKIVARANILHVNLTITTVDEKLARLLEPYAPRPELRLQAIRKLAQAGIRVGVLPNPVMPLLTDSDESLDALAAAAKGAGATSFGGGILFLKPCAQKVFFPFLEEHFPGLARAYREEYENRPFLRGAYADEMKERIRAARKRHGLDSDGVDYRPEFWMDEPQLSLFTLEDAAGANPFASETRCL
jgi:DNA repair photolyase